MSAEIQAPFPSAGEIASGQLRSLNELLGRIIPANPFYTRKVLEGALAKQFDGLQSFSSAFPFTTKDEIARDQEKHPLFGRNLTFPLEAYSRMHQTSGTTGQPLRWLDTPESWEMLLDCWLEVYRAAGVTRKDVAYFAFSFGPFLGFWLAFEAAARAGCLCLPGGGLTSLARLKMILENRATVLCCTPSYAIHLADVAREERIGLTESPVRKIIVAGEPGGSLPATRARIERLWPGAKVFDHHGMTEVGPVTYECPAKPCRLHVVDWAYFAEVVDPETGAAVPSETDGELILTTLKRIGSPLLRYRTGDLVRKVDLQSGPCECGRHDTALEGGILGRTDDMTVVRGVNIYPTAVEQIIREFADVAEYQVRIGRKGALTEIHVLIEPAANARNVTDLVVAVEKALHTAFSLRIPVTGAPVNSLPRAEFKARRWIKS
jgi:phenylacetate-CoA ligase